MNKIWIIGNLCADPQKRSTADGTAVCTFTVAVNRRQSAKAGQPDADFFRVTAWRKLAENCVAYLAKGRKVAVVGSVSVNTFNGSDGKTRAILEVNADDVEFLTPRSEQGEHPATTAPAPKSNGFVQVDADDLPF